MIFNSIKKKGFTLIELIIVIAIIGILAAIAVPKFGDIQKNSKIKVDIASAKTIADASAVLLAQGKVASTVTFDLVTSKHASPSGDIQIAQNEMFDYLQSVPSPQVPGVTNFQVEVNDNEIAVNAVGTVGTETNPELYPNTNTTAFPK